MYLKEITKLHVCKEIRSKSDLPILQIDASAKNRS
jgi:hypothetical protein